MTSSRSRRRPLRLNLLPPHRSCPTKLPASPSSAQPTLCCSVGNTSEREIASSLVKHFRCDSSLFPCAKTEPVRGVIGRVFSPRCVTRIALSHFSKCRGLSCKRASVQGLKALSTGSEVRTLEYSTEFFAVLLQQLKHSGTSVASLGSRI